MKRGSVSLRELGIPNSWLGGGHGYDLAVTEIPSLWVLTLKLGNHIRVCGVEDPV
jgi:hypothetical protein